MRKAFIAGIAMAAAAGAAQAQDCTLKEIVSLPMQQPATERVIVPVTIDDTPRVMIVDTGAPLGILDATVADELGIKRRAIPPGYDFLDINGGRAKEFATVPSLKIGPEEAKRTDFLVEQWSGDLPEHFAGTLGGDILRNFDADFDFAAGKLNLFSQDHCDGKVVYWAKSYTDADFQLVRDGNIELTMSLDGHDVDAVLDTGSPTTIVNESFVKSALGVDTSSPGIETTPGRDGAPAIYRYRFKSLTVAGVSMPNPVLMIFPDAIARASERELDSQKLQSSPVDEGVRGPQLVLGLDALRQLHLYIAYREKKIYITAADAH
ncbi:MAG TPA: retropepsin-like aspartic protease [Rhizomicrobium sp.]|nr:retropepsin-like aspartic protease [Rhizomicrobium sp.]